MESPGFSCGEDVNDNLGTKVKIRLYGIDAPETAKGRKPGQPYGDESTQLLRQKVDRQQVRVDVMDIDMYRRLVAIVWLGNRNINREMVAEGGAWAYRRYLDRAYASEWIADEDNARRAGKGLWRQGGNIQPPWEFRRATKNDKTGTRKAGK